MIKLHALHLRACIVGFAMSYFPSDSVSNMAMILNFGANLIIARCVETSANIISRQTEASDRHYQPLAPVLLRV
jgi:hypothetical protein